MMGVLVIPNTAFIINALQKTALQIINVQRPITAILHQDQVQDFVQIAILHLITVKNSIPVSPISNVFIMHVPLLPKMKIVLTSLNIAINSSNVLTYIVNQIVNAVRQIIVL